MNEASGLRLSGDPERPLVARGEDVFSRGHIAEQAGILAEEIRKRGVSRALVKSDDPAVILAAIEGCDRARADLYVAHTNLPEDVLAELVENNAIQAVIGGAASWRDVAAPPAEGRIVMMTSGTTGVPKLAAHTLQSLIVRAQRAAEDQSTQDDRWLLTYQPTGFAGIQVTLTAALTRGLLVDPAERTPSGFYAAAKRRDVTHISATPTFWRSLLMLTRPGELSLRQITLGGEAADQVTLDRIAKAFPEARITHTYASTEAGVVYAVHDGLEGFPAAWLEREDKPIQMRIRDGFLQIKTVHSMRGYLGRDDQPLLDDGWLSTADRAEVEGDRVRVKGRDDSTINVGGSKVYPLAIETFLLKQDGVLEARVYGVPNPISGALVAAEVVLDPASDAKLCRQEILKACRAELPSYQQPRVFKVVDEIEVKASGKKG